MLVNGKSLSGPVSEIVSSVDQRLVTGSPWAYVLAAFCSSGHKSRASRARWPISVFSSSSVLRSEVDKRKNNWEKKRSGLSHPGSLLKKERHQDAVWQKVCRLDREVARLVASRTVWFCEEHSVKTVYFEDLRNYQASGGHGDSSWRLSTNLWGQIIETVRYMRESLGHSPYSVWTVNPMYTSQICHKCKEKGIRVDSPESKVEQKEGEYFYCPNCNLHVHADINAARNIMHVHNLSAVPERAKAICPTLPNTQ